MSARTCEIAVVTGATEGIGRAAALAGSIAVERVRPVLWWGVQWHPEYLPQSALQLTATHWFYLYIVWFVPFVLVALFAEHRVQPAAPACDTEPERELVPA